MDDEAVKQPFTFATTDLFDNIEAGNFPSWNVKYQMIDEKDTDFINSLDFDILDTTK
jgi:catalase